MPRNLLLLPCTAAMLWIASPAGAISFNQIDDFQDGTTQGWVHGPVSPAPPANLSDAGPAGVGDHALQIQSAGGGGPGSRLIAFNQDQWTGDYTAAGVTVVTADVFNAGDTDLTLHLTLSGGGGSFSTTVGFDLAAGSGWQSVVFEISAADLSSVNGGFDAALTLASVTELRLLSSPVPEFIGEVIAGELWVDNLRAVPEPGTAALLALGVVHLALARRNR